MGLIFICNLSNNGLNIDAELPLYEPVLRTALPSLFVFPHKQNDFLRKDDLLLIISTLKTTKSRFHCSFTIIKQKKYSAKEGNKIGYFFTSGAVNACVSVFTFTNPIKEAFAMPITIAGAGSCKKEQFRVENKSKIAQKCGKIILHFV